MKKIAITSSKKRKLSFVYTIFLSSLLITTAGVSTFAWFQATASASVDTTSSSADITVSAPQTATFYYFNGNGVPGTSYTGYSKYQAAFGNTVNIVKTDGTYSNAVESDVSIATFANAWTQIDISSSSTTAGVASAANCFNFSKMRPGCYYSFCIDTGLSTSSLSLGFDWARSTSKGINGYDMSPKRYLYNGGTTSYPLNLLMIINAYCYTSSSNNATNYISNTIGITSGGNLSLTDKINFTNVVDESSSGATSESYTLLSSSTNNTATNHFIYYTVFMGTSGKTDAYVYNSTATSIDYYQVSTSGSYSMFDGMKSTLTTLTHG